MRVAVLEIMPSNHGDKLALGISVAVDVPLGGLDRPVTGEQLDIAQRATDPMNQPRRPGDERPASGMRRAAVETDVPECAVEPDHDAQRRHRTAALGSDDRSAAGGETAIGGEGLAKIGVHRDQPAAAVLGRDDRAARSPTRCRRLDRAPCPRSGWRSHRPAGQPWRPARRSHSCGGDAGCR